jgi:cytochrome c oxidase subunit I
MRFDDVLRRYIFSTDHKVIGLQYGFTSMFFLLVGFALVLIIRWQHSYTGDLRNPDAGRL